MRGALWLVLVAEDGRFCADGERMRLQTLIAASEAREQLVL